MRRSSKPQQPQFKDWTYRTKLNHHSFGGSALSVDVICAACGGKYAYEIETFLISTRAHHKEPIYIITDKKGEEIANKTIEEYLLDDVNIFVIDDEYEARVKKVCKKVISHDSYWNHVWIYAKLDILKRALIENPKKGVLLLDCDIILADRVDGSWDADAVLSAHSLSAPLREGHNKYGFYNAGMFLTNRVAVVNDWMNLYTDARPGSFYEQKCLEDISSRWVCEVFPECHNFGKWRREDLSISGRKVRSFHLHLNEFVMYPEQPGNIRLANETFLRNKEKLVLENSQIRLNFKS